MGDPILEIQKYCRKEWQKEWMKIQIQRE